MGCIKFKSSSGEETESSQIMSKKKVLLLGLDSAGKTTILNYFKHGKFVSVESTVGLNIETIIVKTVEILIFDVGGKIRSLWPHYYENLSAIIFVLDSTDKKRLWEIRQELLKLNEEMKFNGIPILIYFNKQDLENVVEYSDLIESIGIKEIFEIDVIIQKCSARTGEGLHEGLEKLVNFVIHNEKIYINKENLTFSSNANVQEKFLKL